METAPKRPDEGGAIAALRALDVLDTGAEEAFDALVRTASLVCETPISLISLIDTERQWFKANLGLPGVSETSRDVAFCAHAVLGDELFEVPDALLDHRFDDNPLVAGDPSIRFYAGAPIRLRDGHRIGTLCAIDRRPRTLTDQQRVILRNLAVAASHALEGRRALLQTRQIADELARMKDAWQLESQRVSGILDGADVGSWELDLATGAVRVNQRWHAIAGDTSNVTMASWLASTHADDRAQLEASLAEHVAGKTARFVFVSRIERPDGTQRWVVDRGLAVREGEGKPISVVGARTDITASREREEALRRSEAFLETTGRIAGIGGWQVDLETGEIIWSDETCRLHGVEPGYRPSLDEGIDYYAPEARPIIRAAVENSIASGRGWDLELPFIRRDGKRMWVRSAGSAQVVDDRVVRLSGAFQDVTERVLEHLALKDANQRIELATDSGGIGIWEYDLVTRDVHWDAWMYRLYGLPVGRTNASFADWENALPLESLLTIRSAVAEAVEGRKPFDVEFRASWPDGSIRFLRTAARVVRDDSGKALRLIGTAWDVTEPRRLAADLRKQSLIASVQAGVAIAANEANTLPLALQKSINLICALTGWTAGHAYLVATGNPELLVPSGIWNPDAMIRHGAFCQQTARTVVPIGVGLVGAVLAEKRAIWRSDLSTNDFPRHDSAMAAGLRWGMAAPVLVGNQVVAVLEFYSSSEQVYDPSYVELLAYVGVQLGRVIDREHAHSRLRQQTETLKAQAMVDELTGLYNRRGFMELAQERLEVAARTSQRAFLLFADLDGMKAINDNLGHDMGDLALVQASHVLRRTLRAIDVVARLGGDEFVALMCETGTFDDKTLVARLEEDLAALNASGDLKFELRISFGISGPARADESIDQMLKTADSLMYEQKARRKRARGDGSTK